jgi:hypothetical protein
VSTVAREGEAEGERMVEVMRMMKRQGVAPTRKMSRIFAQYDIFF